MADWPPLKNSTFTVYFPIYDNDGDLVSAAASLDSEVSIDGGAFTDVSPGEATEIGSSGIYSLPLTASEMNGDVIVTITKTTTSDAKTAVNVMYTVARQLKDLAYPATSGRSIQVETDGMIHADVKEWLGVAPNALQSGRVDVYVGAMGSAVIAAATFAAGAIDSTAVATGAIDADAIATDAITAAEIADGAIDAGAIAAGAITAAKFAAGAIDAAAIANAAIDAATFAAGAIDAGAIAADAIGASEFAQAAADKVWSSATRNLTALGFVLQAADIGADAIGASELATDAVNEIRDAILSDSTPFAGAAITEARLSELDQATAGKMANEVDLIKAATISVTGSVSDAGPTSTDFDTDLTEASDDHYNMHWLIFTSGNLAGQARPIRDYTGSSKNCAFDRAYTEAPTNGDDFTVLANVSPALDVLLARLSDVENESAVSNRMVLWAIAKLVNKVDASSSPLTVCKTDDATTLFQQAMTENASANPIEVLDTT